MIRDDSTMVVRPLFQGEDGGSIPTSSLKELLLFPISHKMAKEVYAKWHYLGDKGLMSSFNYGVFWNDQCFGAISYGIPNARNCFPHYTQRTQGEWLELKRLALSDALGKNSESRVIAISLRLLRRARKLSGIVTYADTERGHVGTIYRASGFTYCGLTAQKTDLFVDGKKLGKVKGVKYSEIVGEWRKRSRKHLFVKKIT